MDEKWEQQNREIRCRLEELADTKYQKFSVALIPGEQAMLGVRIPLLRNMAKELAKGNWAEYLSHASDDSMEEVMLQGLTLGYVKEPFEEIEPFLQRFIPKIRNWSLCDSTCNGLKIAQKEPERVWDFLQDYLGSKEPYEIRFGVVMLLSHFMKEEYIGAVLQWMERIHSEDYYVKMAVAWNLSVCYVKFPVETWEFMQRTGMDPWTLGKAIQKISESYRVSREEKRRLREWKKKKDEP